MAVRELKPPPPSPEEVERDLFGTALYDTEALGVLVDETAPDMFSTEDHRKLRTVLGEMVSKGDGVDPSLVLHELRHRDEGTSMFRLLEAVTGSGIPSHAPEYARVVREEADRRNLLRFSQRLGARALEEDPGLLRVEALNHLTKDGEPLGARPDVLEVDDLADVAAAIDAAPPVGFLAEPVWPTDAYGVLGAEDKAGKSWAALDLAVSVAAGGEWLDRFPVRESGIVLVLYGEGGKRRLVRRLRAIARWKDVDLDDLPIRVAPRVPHLTASGDLDALQREVETCPPKLIVLDPLYLAARGARGSDLYEMGEHLENVQRIAEGVGSALLVVTHFNKTGDGRGPKRFTGAGPGAWGRVLVTADVVGRHTEEDTTATVATLDLAFTGDEIPDTNMRIRRRVWAEDPSDLASPLRYELEEAEGERITPDGLTPAVARVLEILDRAESPMLVSAIGDATADDGWPLKKRTIQNALKQLEERGLAEPEDAGSGAFEWSRPKTGPDLRA